MTSLEDRLNRVEAQNQIIAQLHSYCRQADLLNPPGMLAHFTEECLVSYVVGGPPMTKAELKAMLEQYLPNTTSSQHMITNHELVFLSEDEVLLHTYMYSWQRYKDYPMRSDTHRFGRYECRVVRRSGKWLFTHMNLISAGELGESRIAEQLGRPWPPVFGAAA